MRLVRRYNKQDGAPRRSEVVTRVEKETTEAAEIARIAGQHRLTDPRTNPAVREHADRLRNDEHRTVLDSQHRRVQRQHRVEDRRAGHAERALEAIQEARETRSPAESVLALHAGRSRYMKVSLATSVALAFGSAMGLEKLAETHRHIPEGSGYIAEVGLTGLATIVILARSELAQHGGKLKTWHDVVLWTLMVAPLAASMAANVYGKNLIGAICAAGAAAFSLFSYVIAEAFADSAEEQAKKVTDNAEDQLRDIASGEDLFSREEPGAVHQTFFEAQGLPFMRVAFEPRKVLMATPELDPPTVPTPEHNGSGHHVATQQTAATARPSGHSAVPTSKPTLAREHEGNDRSAPEPTDEPSRVATDGHAPEPTPMSTPPVATSEPMGTESGARTPKPVPKPPAKPTAKRRTRDEIRAELQAALKEHYDNGGGEPQVKPLAEKISVNRRIVRELLDEMNVRPMIRKAVGQ